MSKALATKNVVAVLIGFGLILAFTFSFASTAKADALSDLQAQVNALLAQIAALQAGSTGSVSGGACFTFTMTEQLGSTGGEVMQVQQFLNSHGAQVAASGAGSPGNETSHFGALTKAAVAKFQAANGVSPAAGYWGPITRAKANSMCAGGMTGGTVSGGGGIVVPTGPGITVMASAQPANSLAPQSASRVPMTSFTLTNNTGAAVTVTGVRIQRTLLANDAVFSGVVLVDQNGAQIGVSRTFDSNHQATIGDTVTLNPGQSMTYTVAGNMASSLSSYGGQVVGVSVIGINTSVPVNGSLPITGAQMTINSTLSIGTVTAALSSFDPNGKTNKNIGDTAVRFTGVRLTAGSAEDVKLYSIRWRMNGSASASDIANLVTIVNGTSYPTTLSADGRYVTATFAGGILVAKGFSADAYVQGDLVGSNSSGRVVEFDLDKTSDVYVVGQTYGYGIILTSSGAGVLSTDSTHGTAINTSNQPWFQGSTVTIQGGTVTTISNATEVASQNISISVPNQPLGGFATNFTGEPVSVQTMVFDVATTSSACNTANGVCLLTNVSIVDSAGAVVAGPVNAAQATGKQTLSFSNTVTFPVGRRVYSLKGTVGSAEVNGQTFVVSTTPSSASYWSNITGQSTGNTVSLSGVGSFNMNTMTVRGAALTMSLSSTPSAQTIVKGGQSVLFANIQLDSSQSGEDVRINSIPLHVDQAYVASTAAVTGLSACQISDSAGNVLNSGSNIVNSLTADATTTLATTNTKTFTLNNSLTIPKGTVVTLTLKCSVSSSATSNDSYRFKTFANDTLTFTGATSGNSASATIVSSQAGRQTIAAAGTVTVGTDSSSPSYAISAGGTTGVIAGVAKFNPSNEDVNLTKVGLTLNNGTYTGVSGATDIVQAYIYSGSTLVGTATFAGNATSATSTLLSQVPLTKNVDSKLTIKVDLADIGTSQPGVAGDLVKIDVVNFEGSGVSSGSTVYSGAAAGLTAVSGVAIYNTFPTVAQGTLPTTSASAGKLIRFAVTADSHGDVGLARFTFTVATSSGITIASMGLYGYTDSSYSTAISGQGTSGLIGSTVTATSTQDYRFEPTASLSPVQVPAGSTRYFELRGSVGGATTGSSITTTLKGDASTLTLAATSTSQANANFLWSPNDGTTASTGATVDWTNAYSVVGLPSGGLTQSVTQ